LRSAEFPANKLPIIASSSSAIAMSKISEGMKFKEQCIISHPVNPPFTIPLVEIVPAPWTKPDVTARTRALLQDIGQSPVTLLKECPGFLLNRLQYAILAEAFRIVDDGLCTPEDVDACMANGLARRWVFMGPFQTIDLNAPKGVQDYCDRYGKTILEIVEQQDNSRKWSPELVTKINEAARKMNGSVEEIPKALAWRDDRLAKLQSHLDKQSNLNNFKKSKL
jgi:L-gulonate 3-dehydrogenase